MSAESKAETRDGRDGAPKGRLSPLHVLSSLGQSVWIDSLSRDSIRSGHLRGLMEGALRSAVNGGVPRRLVELGAGDGAFMLQLARQFAPRWPGLCLTLVDQQRLVTPQTRGAFSELGWSLECIQADAFDWIREPCRSRHKENQNSIREQQRTDEFGRASPCPLPKGRREPKQGAGVSH